MIPRLLENKLRQTLARGKSILLLGPRQTGKTTLIEHYLQPDILYSFAQLSSRQRYEQDPSLLEKELEQQLKNYSNPPWVYIDEVQKIPEIMDMAQYLIDHKKAQFILSGSSARKLKQGPNINLLPGRVVNFIMPPLLFSELPDKDTPLEELLLYGTLPAIISEPDADNREQDLQAYVSTYLEDEIRAEALVRNVGNFSRFLEIAAGESGRQINFTKLSQQIGIQDTTIKNYYQILEDCLIAHRIDPITKTQSKRRLVTAPKYLFFDLGLRRVCANEGTRLPQNTLGHLFEHFVGNELLNLIEIFSPSSKLRYWRDNAGPEVDYVLEQAQHYTPIEVKWTDKPKESDIRHLKKFLNEYDNCVKAYVVCRTPHAYAIAENIMALPWQELQTILSS